MKKHLLTCVALLPFWLFAQQTYVWNISSGKWQDPSSWLPLRTDPAPDDVLEFRSDASVTDMPPADVIGQLRIYDNAVVYISPPAAATVQIGHNSLSGPHFTIDAGAAFHISGENAVVFQIGASHQGAVDGEISFAGGSHRLLAESPGSLLFKAGAVFTSAAGFSGSAFGNTFLNSVVFQSGATYIFIAGSTPFGADTPDAVAVFESGSNYIHRTNTPVPAFAGRTYGNLVIDGTVNFAGIGSARDCIIQNDLRLISGFFSFKPNTIATHTGSFFIGGNIICEGNTWIDIGNINMTGAVVLNGADQFVGGGDGSGNISLYNMVQNNHTTSLERPLVITNNIYLQHGKIITTADAELVLDVDAGVTSCTHNYDRLPYIHIGCDDSFVEGPVKKLGLNNSSFAFPVGEGNKLRPLLLQEASGDFTVNYIRSDPYLDISSAMGPGVHHISHLEYWHVASNGSGRVTLTYYDPNSGGVTDMNALRVTRYDGAVWQHQGVTGYEGVPGSNGAITSNPVSEFGFFSLASSSDYPTNPLPLDIYLFTVTEKDNKAVLEWNIPGMIDPEKVVVEKLLNDSFIAVSHHLAHETMAFDENLLPGKNIYRLKIITRAGRVYITDNKSVIGDFSSGIRVYPNPAREKIFIKVPVSSSISELLIVNISGSVLKRIPCRNQTAFEINILDLPPGVYLLQPGQTHFPIGRFIKFN